MSNLDNDSATLDVYCLECGYNLRGHAGDPRRCPECGHLNRVEDLEVPAKLIRRALRRLESGAAICGASAAVMLLVVPLLIVMVILNAQPPTFAWIFVVSVGVAAMIFFVVGMFHFRRSCAPESRWLAALVRFTLLGCAIAVTGLTGSVAFFSAVAYMGPFRLPHVGERIAVAIAMLPLSVWLYRVAKRAIHPLQRETAARFARTHFYNKGGSVS
ncbi:MAG: hypothetical protein IIB59_05830 [Planctomycetes bacterium]|nr:hypothetical protein [Planctomycetota bacterium]